MGLWMWLFFVISHWWIKRADVYFCWYHSRKICNLRLKCKKNWFSRFPFKTIFRKERSSNHLSFLLIFEANTSGMIFLNLKILTVILLVTLSLLVTSVRTQIDQEDKGFKKTTPPPPKISTMSPIYTTLLSAPRVCPPNLHLDKNFKCKRRYE